MAKIQLNDINKEQVTTHKIKIEANGDIIDNMVNETITKYTLQLDEYMGFVKQLLEDTTRPPTTEELDDIIMNLPVLLYFTAAGQETVGVKEDVAKAFRRELYNKQYGEASGTVGDKTAYAELETRSEELVEIAYKRAYRKIKLRLELANETLQSVKKVLTRRMEDIDIAKRGGR